MPYAQGTPRLQHGPFFRPHRLVSVRGRKISRRVASRLRPWTEVVLLLNAVVTSLLQFGIAPDTWRVI